MHATADRLSVTRVLTTRAKLAAAAVSVVAVMLAATSAASAGTTAHRARGSATGAAAAAFTWHRLTLINGWRAIHSSEVDRPAYAIRDGVVYLTGDVRLPTAGSAEFAVLPKAARPAHTVYRLVNSGATVGWLQIGTDGGMQAFNSDPQQAWFGTMITTVSYLAAGTRADRLHLIHGWVYGQHPYGTGNPSYAVRRGVVYLSGSVWQPSGSNYLFAVLPKAARPAHKVFIADYMFGGALGDLIIEPNGDMFASGKPQTAAQGFTSLAAIAFPAPGASWHRLALINGWKSGQSTTFPTGGPVYTVIQGVVYLAGSVREPHGAQFFFAAPARAARPAFLVSAPVVSWGGSLNSVNIAPNGKTFFLNVPASTRRFTALTGVSFPRSN